MLHCQDWDTAVVSGDLRGLPIGLSFVEVPETTGRPPQNRGTPMSPLQLR